MRDDEKFDKWVKENAEKEKELEDDGDGEKFNLAGRDTVELDEQDTCVLFKGDGSIELFITEERYDILQDAAEEEEVQIPETLISVSKLFLTMNRTVVPSKRPAYSKMYPEELN